MKDIGRIGVCVMKHNISFTATRRFLPMVMAMGLAVISTAAHAQAVEGCNPRVLDAMQQKAQAKVVYDVAVAEQITDKPDSVLNMSCFNQAASAAASVGAMFSGDFTTDLAPVIVPALTSLYRNFNDADGNDAGIISYVANNVLDVSTGMGNYNCDAMQQLWTRAEQRGVNNQTPFMTFADLVGAVVPGGAGDDFVRNMNAPGTQAILSALNTVMNDPQFTSPSTVPAAIAPLTSCQALVDFGVIPGPC